METSLFIHILDWIFMMMYSMMIVIILQESRHVGLYLICKHFMLRKLWNRMPLSLKRVMLNTKRKQRNQYEIIKWICEIIETKTTQLINEITKPEKSLHKTKTLKSTNFVFLNIHWGKADDRNCNYGHPKMADVESSKNLFCRLNCFCNVF